MTFQRSAVGILAAVCMAIVACSNTAGYEGRNVSQWMGLLSSDSASERAEAAYVLSERLPTDASIPLIARLLVDSVEMVREESVAALISIGRTSPPRASAVRSSLAASLKSPSANARALAANVIGGLGEADAPTLSLLSVLLSDRYAHVRAAAASAFGNASQRGDNRRLSLLISLVADDSSAVVRAAAAETLGTLNAAGLPVVTALRHALRDTSPMVREHAAFAIGNAPNAGPDVVGPLTEALDDAAPEVRGAAAQSLTNLGRRAMSAGPALHRALSDSVAFVRARASQALDAMRRP